MSTDSKTVATTYFSAWRSKDFDALRDVLADNVTFRGPMGTADGAQDCIEGLQQMAQSMSDIEIHAMVADGPDVVTWYDLHMSGVEPMPTANWSHVEDGRITAIRATFDPRPLLESAPK
jgi:ketosteroid isomerase-like protein